MKHYSEVKNKYLQVDELMRLKNGNFLLIFFFVLLAITNAAVDLSPVLLGILFTLVLLCFVIFAKLYCFRSATMITNDSNSDSKHMSNINYKNDAAKVRKCSLSW